MTTGSLGPSKRCATISVMHIPRRRQASVAAAWLLIVLALPAAVSADAELVATVPEAGSTVDASPPTVSATFDDELRSSKSSIEVIGADGMTIAEGGLSSDDARKLVVAVPALAPGTYEVRWTAASSDGHILRDTFRFTVAQVATPAPTPMTTIEPTPAASQTASPTPVSPSASPVVSPAPSPAPDGSGGGSESIGQLLVIAVVGIGVGLGIGWWRSRRAG